MDARGAGEELEMVGGAYQIEMFAGVLHAVLDSEPLRFLGEAMQKLDRPAAAVDAYTEAAALGPDVPNAWYGLALAYAALGNTVASKRAESRLADLDRDLVAQLHDAIERLGVVP